MDIAERLGSLGESLRNGLGESFRCGFGANSEILFFILIFLILFTDFFPFGHGCRE